MRNVTKAVLLVCTALTALALASCNAIADTSGLTLTPDTVWIRLVPSVAVEGKATLVLDFSKPVADLTKDTPVADLTTLFTFKNGEGMSGAEAITATGITKDSDAVYRLTVVNVPDVEKGIVLVTINKQGIAPPTRAWSLDGEIVPDEPALTSAPSIALTTGHEQLGYTITASDPVADSYDVYYIEGSETDGAMIKSGGTRIAGASTTGTITGLTNDAFYSVIVTAHKADYAECDSAVVQATPCVPQPVYRYVKQGGSGDGSGASWANASGNIQTMMDELEQAGGGEVWVAAGKYTPGSTRDSTFALKNNVKVYGGFPAGITSDTALNIAMHDRSARFNTVGIISDAACETILSGDIDNNDTYELSTGFLTTGYAENAYHVVTGANAVLDGFTVKGGYADGTDYGTGKGGGIYNSDGSLTLSNLTITGNSAVSNEYSESGYGGGIFNRGSSGKLILTNATIAGNKVYGTEFTYGGGMCNIDCTAILTNVTIAGNKADGSNGGSGGGIYYYGSYSRLVLTNVAITGNEASLWGGGIVSADYSKSTLTNVTIAGNRAPTGGGILNQFSDVNIRNSIVWGNTSTAGGAQVIITDIIPLTWSYSIVEGSGGSSGPWNTAFGTDDGNNIDSAADPFVSSVPASSAPTKAGNYRLGGTVGVNAGNNSPSVPAYLTYVYWPTDLMGDWTTYYNSLTDLDGLTRKMNGTVDMGAYEKQ
jgi:hypothetical protein